MSEDLRAVAAAIFSKDSRKVLAIKCPDDPNDSLAGLWELPAIRVFQNEEEIIAARKIGPEKLGIEIEPLERWGQLQGERALGITTLALWKCNMEGIPDFSKRLITNPNATKYTAWAWKNPHELVVSAEKGSLCNGLRDPQFHTEYKDTWGLPSIGMSYDEFLNLETDPDVIQAIMQRLAKNKLNGVDLIPDRFVGWTGRLRSPKVDPQFTEPYYLIMVDLITKPVDPSNIPMSTPAYSSLLWLTPQEHAEIVTASPKKACDACSQLAFAVANQGKL